VKTLSIPFYHPDRKRTTKNGCQAHEYQAHKFSNFFFMVAVGKILASKDPMPSCCCSSTLKYHNSNVKKRKPQYLYGRYCLLSFRFSFSSATANLPTTKLQRKTLEQNASKLAMGDDGTTGP
jgi:hypothetical protein